MTAGRHGFVIDKRETPTFNGRMMKPQTAQESQDTLRTYGNLSRNNHAPFPDRNR